MSRKPREVEKILDELKALFRVNDALMGLAYNYIACKNPDETISDCVTEMVKVRILNDLSFLDDKSLHIVLAATRKYFVEERL